MAYLYSVALVTGASSGIGRALALELSRRGCMVGLVARREAPLRALAAECGTRTCVATCDVTDPAAVRAAHDRVVSELGPLDLCVANAGVSYEVRPDRFEFAEVQHVVGVNVLGAMATIYAALPPMLARGRGQIAGISSLAGYLGLPGNGAYSASKAYLSNHLEALRAELRPRGVHVTTVCPGFIETPLVSKNRFRMPFLMSAEKAARKILGALERRRRVYNFPWPMGLAVQAARLVPRWLYDWVVAQGPVHAKS
ncbi:MAG: short-chain dehydrogenase/reductase [Planctomycetota bacterium]|nr:short-chain dehydrogenase [Planctomycetota bacterium]GIK53887.1 MAG: short-chain dehydrogenase/reductase [Planctomycetota bacterium]